MKEDETGRNVTEKEASNRFATRCDLQWKEHKGPGVSNVSFSFWRFEFFPLYQNHPTLSSVKKTIVPRWIKKKKDSGGGEEDIPDKVSV